MSDTNEQSDDKVKGDEEIALHETDPKDKLSNDESHSKVNMIYSVPYQLIDLFLMLLSPLLAFSGRPGFIGEVSRSTRIESPTVKLAVLVIKDKSGTVWCSYSQLQC